jgi:hypothetical protein
MSNPSRMYHATRKPTLMTFILVELTGGETVGQRSGAISLSGIRVESPVRDAREVTGL